MSHNEKNTIKRAYIHCPSDEILWKKAMLYHSTCFRVSLLWKTLCRGKFIGKLFTPSPPLSENSTESHTSQTQLTPRIFNLNYPGNQANIILEKLGWIWTLFREIASDIMFWCFPPKLTSNFFPFWWLSIS